MPTRKTVVTRLGGLLPDVDTIVQAYGVDQRKAKKIRSSMGNILELIGDLIIEQTELIEGQAVNALMIETQVDKTKDALTIINNLDVFLSGDPATVGYILKMVFTDVFADEFGKLEAKRQIELFAALRRAINSLKRHDNILAEPA